MARRAGRVLVAITFCLTALGAGLGRAAAASSATTAAPIPPNAWVVADAGSGAILSSHNDHVAYLPASTTKIMTAVTAVERLPPDAIIKVSALAAGQPSSKINMLVGQRWRFADALASLLVVSANDAAYAIAEAAGGSVAGFAHDEAVIGRELGMRNSTFSDPAGLDDGNAFRGGPLMSAYDIAISTNNALRVPLLARFAASPSVSFTGPDGVHHTLVNHNKMVSQHLYAGATGFKTGFTDRAGHTLVATATRNGRTLIAVILGTWDAYGWAARLLDAGFATAPGHGTGETLPPARVTTYAGRAAEIVAFRTLAGAPVASASPTAPPTTARARTSSAPAPTTRSAVGAGLGAGTRLAAATSPAKAHGGGLSTRTTLFALLVLLVASFYLLRVRAVRRARARRLARRQATHSMMRRGALPVVDGRYRTGTRVGKPLESDVQIRREAESGEAEASG